MTSPDQPQWLTADQANQMVADAVASALAQHQQAATASGTISADQVQAMVDQALARQAEAHQAELQGLVASLRGNVITFIPEHGGGPGLEIAPTWSQYEQQQAIQAADRAKASAAA